MQTQAARPPGATTFQRSYPGRADYIQRVRADLAPFASRCPRADDLITAASELAANAALHSRSSRPGGEFTVRADLYPGDYAWLEVEDKGGPWATRNHHDDRPHGLDIVTLLAGPGNWGTDDTSSGGRVIWVRLDWTAEP